MQTLSGLLITVRTSKQGAAMETGKTSLAYQEEISTLTISAEDLATLALKEQEKVLIRSDAGEALVTCRLGEGPKGIFFLPLGPVANQLIGLETMGTGVPDFKGIPVKITLADLAD